MQVTAFMERYAKYAKLFNVEDFMKRFILKVVFGVMVVLFLSCASQPTKTYPYKPLRNISNDLVIGTVQAKFESPYWVSALGQYISRLNLAAYNALLEVAKREYGESIDVADISWVKIQYDKTQKMYEYSANGKVVNHR